MVRKVISWLLLSLQDVRGLCTRPLESISRGYSLSLFVCHTLIHIETNVDLFCWFFYSHLLFLSSLLSLLGKHLQKPRVVDFNSPVYFKHSTAARLFKSNIFRVLSRCKLQNLPNIMYRIIIKDIRPIYTIGSRIP